MSLLCALNLTGDLEEKMRARMSEGFRRSEVVKVALKEHFAKEARG